MKKTALFFLFFCLIVGVGMYFFFSAHQRSLSAKEKIHAMKHLIGHDPILSDNPARNTWVEHTGRYVTFSYPGATTIYPVTTDMIPARNSLEIFMFQSENPKYFFGTEVLQAQDIAAYSDIPGVIMRRNNKNDYTETEGAYKNISFPIFTKMQNQSVEKTAFILINGKEYTFSITSANPNVLSIFDAVLQSMQLH